MTSEHLVRLSCGALHLELSPLIGGAISAIRWIGELGPKPILRECNSPLENVLDAACFPLVPYVNRIRGGNFTFRGRRIRLSPNMRGDPSPLHGQGWLSPWQVERSDGAAATLGYRHEADEWPWAYEARQELSLDQRGLSLRLTCRNLSQGPMPCGLGIHPYFPCGSATRLATQTTCAWTIDEHVLPLDRVPATGPYDLSDRLVCGQGLDNGWGGWGGLARMTDPDWPYEIEMSSPQAKFFQLYSPRPGGIFVAEPVTHANAALNAPECEWLDLGMRVLEPDQSMTLDARLEVIAK